VRISSDVVYCFSPANASIAREVGELAQAYVKYRHDLLAFISSRRRQSLRDFSEAFRLALEPDDDR
jgi:hypothetical protein